MKPIVSFDFDSTLSLPHVQEYAAKLIAEGFDVWVITSRYDNLHRHRWTGGYTGATNDDLWEVIEKLNIPRWKVRFTNMHNKSTYLAYTKVLWHLDDDSVELFEIRDDPYVKTIGIQVNSGSWQQKCERLLMPHREPDNNP